MSKERGRRQWHPFFAELLRPLLQDYFDVQTNVPVGDVPREADILLLQRSRREPNPFTGLWRHLATWNVVEFKGPSVSARVRDLDLLVELGLGIDRHLNEELRHQRQRPLAPLEVSFWYLTNSPGRRFLREAQQRFGTLDQIEQGVWRSQIMQRLVFLVSNSTVALEKDTIPVHLAAAESVENQLALIRVIASQPDLWASYSPFVASQKPALWEEIERMARTKDKGPQFDLHNLVQAIGAEETLKQIFDSLGAEKIIAEMKRKPFLKKLSAKEKQQLRELLEELK